MSALASIEPGKAKRIGAIAALLGSNQAGEVVAAANLLGRELAKYDLRIGDVVERGLAPPQLPPPVMPGYRAPGVAEHVVHAGTCLMSGHLYNAKEQKFLKDVRKYRSPTPKQLDWLDALYARWTKQEEDF